jgi:hypothetical protein
MHKKSDFSKNDVLYIQSSDDDSVPALLDFGKQWQVDDCEIFDRDQMARILGRLTTLIEVLGEEKMTRQVEQWKSRQVCAPVVSMWWKFPAPLQLLDSKP